ncbi:Thiopurine S-methyltransferase [Armadillidium vulgare]|nr:Thiopurine S-methyltransferase [Armadillidium vulgare]
MDGNCEQFYSTVYTKSDNKTLYDTLWSSDATPWETSELHPLLRDNSLGLDLCPPKRVLVPFCGNAIELKWFYEKGLEVVGVELIEIPVRKFFTQHELAFEVKELHGKKVYETPDKRLKIYVSDFFDMTTDDIGKFEVVWDRFAQLAVKRNGREKYSNLIKTLCKEKFVYIMSTLQFEQIHDDPDQIPISVSHEESRKMFGDDWCNMKLIFQKNIIEDYPFLKGYGREEFFESCFLLTPK